MRSKLRKWFDDLEKILNLQAESAGLMDHNATVGEIREFFVQEVLSKILPPNVTVGSGKVISSGREKMSKQIDIIIFDNRCFRLSITGDPRNSLYPVEGVIATIEIKSELNSDTLNQALDNCFSVMRLPLQIQSEEKNDWLERYKELSKNNVERAGREWDDVFIKYAEVAGEDELNWRIGPRTYIFAFHGYKEKYGLLSEAVFKWISENEDFYCSHYAPNLPRIIVGEGVIGITRDAKIRMKKNHAFMAFQTNVRFGLMITHLLSVISDRIKPRYDIYNISFDMQKYMPMDIYAKEIKEAPKQILGITDIIGKIKSK